MIEARQTREGTDGIEHRRAGQRQVRQAPCQPAIDVDGFIAQGGEPVTRLIQAVASTALLVEPQHVGAGLARAFQLARQVQPGFGQALQGARQRLIQGALIEGVQRRAQVALFRALAGVGVTDVVAPDTVGNFLGDHVVMGQSDMAHQFTRVAMLIHQAFTAGFTIEIAQQRGQRQTVVVTEAAAGVADGVQIKWQVGRGVMIGGGELY